MLLDKLNIFISSIKIYKRIPVSVCNLNSSAAAWRIATKFDTVVYLENRLFSMGNSKFYLQDELFPTIPISPLQIPNQKARGLACAWGHQVLQAKFSKCTTLYSSTKRVNNKIENLARVCIYLNVEQIGWRNFFFFHI